MRNVCYLDKTTKKIMLFIESNMPRDHNNYKKYKRVLNSFYHRRILYQEITLKITKIDFFSSLSINSRMYFDMHVHIDLHYFTFECFNFFLTCKWWFLESNWLWNVLQWWSTAKKSEIQHFLPKMFCIRIRIGHTYQHNKICKKIELRFILYFYQNVFFSCYTYIIHTVQYCIWKQMHIANCT